MNCYAVQVCIPLLHIYIAAISAAYVANPGRTMGCQAICEFKLPVIWTYQITPKYSIDKHETSVAH